MTSILATLPADVRAMLRAATDEELCAMYVQGQPGREASQAEREAAAMARAELTRRDRNTTSKRRRAQADAAWLEAAHAHYLAAEAECCGNLTARGSTVGEPYPGLYRLSDRDFERQASEEMRNFCEVNHRPTRAEFMRAEFRPQREEREEAEAMDGDAGGLAEFTAPAATAAQEPQAGPGAGEDIPPAGEDAEAAEDAAVDERIAQRAREREERAAQREMNRRVQDERAAIAQAKATYLAASAPGAGLAVPGTAGLAAPVPPGVQPYRFEGLEITGDVWLSYMRRFFARYVYWPSEAALDAAVLWAAHTYGRESTEDGAGLIWSVTPRFFVLSSERNSGKSTVMRLFAMVCPRVGGIETEPTEYGMLLSIHAEKPTLLIDELGILLGTDKRKAAVQQILLNGYTPLGTKLRERNKQVERVQLFAPIALAGLDVVEKTVSENIRAILSRGPILHMKPAPSSAEPPDLDDEEAQAAAMVRRIQIAGLGWTVTNREYFRGARAVPAEGAHRRWRQIWGPLLVLADAAGGEWPQRGRDACAKLQHGYASGDEGQQRSELAAMLAEMEA